jgi:hypothetical protein
MKNMKERKLARNMIRGLLGLSVKLEDIVPLESSHSYGRCDYVMFSIKNRGNILYRENESGMTIEKENGCEINIGY